MPIETDDYSVRNELLRSMLMQVVMKYPAVVPLLQEKTLEFLGVEAEAKTEEHFRRVLLTLLRKLYRDDIDGLEWVNGMIDIISQQLTKAWNEGARMVGFNPADMDNDDLFELQKIINEEYKYVIDLGSAIEQAKFDESGYVQFYPRIELWVNRYKDVVNRAVIWFAGRHRLKWVLGATENHCDTCAALNGVVATAAQWERSGYHPQQPPNPLLDCEGWKCECGLLPTTEKRTKGGIPKIKKKGENA